MPIRRAPRWRSGIAGSSYIAEGYGIAQLEYGVPITPSTIFHVASVSKEFTAFAVGLLAERGLVSWDDNIRKHIPEVPDFGIPITLRHLVHHISGMRDQWELLAVAGWRLDDVITKDQILRLVSRQRELNFAPGEEYLYCNTGFTLLAEVVARVTGRSFREWTQQEIFDPLGMSSTHFHDDHEMIVPNRAYSYSGNREAGFKKRVLSYANAGATSLFTTVEDMMNWARNFQDTRLGSSKLQRSMRTSARLNSGREIGYGMGLSIGSYRGRRTLGHGGADAGFRSQFLLFPKNDFAVMVMSNLASFNGGRLARQITDIYLAGELDPVQSDGEALFEPIPLPDSTRQALAGSYLAPDGRLITLEIDGTDLHARPIGQPPFPLQARDGKTLVNRERRLEFQFEVNGPQVKSLEVVQGGGSPVTADRVTLMELTPAKVSELSGLYYSPELDTSYRIMGDADGLWAIHQRHPPIPLKAGASDQLFGDRWYFGQVRLERDEAGELSGFRLQGGRVRNLRFERRSKD